jgi:hypothetical protein
MLSSTFATHILNWNEASAPPSGTDASRSTQSSGSVRKDQEHEEDQDPSSEELTPPPSHYSSDIFADMANEKEEATQGNTNTVDSESEDDSNSDCLSGEEYENESTGVCHTSSSGSEDEEDENGPGNAKIALDSREGDATDSSDGNSVEIDTPARKKKCPDRYCEFTWAELSHSTEPVPHIPKPDGTGGRDYNIKEMIGLGSNHQDDIDTYKDILVNYFRLPFTD